MTNRLMDDPAAAGMQAGRADNRTERERTGYPNVREIDVTVTLRMADGGLTTHTTTLAILEEQDPVLLAQSAAATAAKSAQMKPVQYLSKGVGR